MPGSPTITALASFTAATGDDPNGGLVLDAAGDLFGTTYGAGTGTNAAGTIFVLANLGGLYATTPMVLSTFTGANGAGPVGGLLMDAQQDLFGVTVGGGANSDGAVFELVHSSFGYQPATTTLASFSTSSLYEPLGGLVMDGAGDLIGAADLGGSASMGGVFAVAKALGAYVSPPVSLATFSGPSGAFPVGPVIENADAAGDLFGATELGGANGNGAIYEVAKAGAGYATSATLVASFSAALGGPRGGLVADAAGDLFGTMAVQGTFLGGIFEVAKTANGYAATPTVLATFNGANGSDPASGLIIDAAGDLFGTAQYGGTGFDLMTSKFSGDGGVFELAKTATGYASAPVFTSLSGTNGSDPVGTLVADAAGNLFGVGSMSGTSSTGTIFEVTNSGFVVACFARGTRIATATGEVAVEHLVVGDTVRTASGGGRPIIWIGRRRIDCRRHPRPESVRPIRIAAGAFGPAMPVRDLFLSPDHAVLRGGALVPASRLVDGARVRQEPWDAVTYFHVELDAHDVLLADGLPCESYRDTGNRASFANAPPVPEPLARAA